MSVISQPLADDILPRLDPGYVAFHKANLLYTPLQHQRAWDPAMRRERTVPGNSEPLKVGSVRDIALEKCAVRVFTPEGSPPAEGWPVLLYFHGGGWTLGNIDSENTVCTNLCKRAKCVVVTVDYRLGPENPYPAAVEDALESLQWLYGNGKAELNVDVNRIAVAGSSSGGNLTAILALKAPTLTPPIPLVIQLPFVPVTDNTASTSGKPYASWAENKNTVWLSPDRMMWFRRFYLPNEADWTEWEASPIFAPDDLYKNACKAYIVVCDVDILRDEGIAYGEKLKKAGVEVEVRIYKGAPHQIMAMDGVVSALGRQTITDAVEALGKAFGTL